MLNSRAATAVYFLLCALAGPLPASAQEPPAVAGRVTDAESGAPAPAVAVSIDGHPAVVLTDSLGRYRISPVPPGPQVLVLRRIGFASARVPIVVPSRGTLIRDVQLASSPLRLETLTVTADPAGRAEGELGTATVIDREAIAHQAAASLAGVLELVPGMVVAPPGLDAVQQVSLRTVPTSNVQSLTVGGPDMAALASFGTQIVLDGVPLSNNANLQTVGARGDPHLQPPSSAGGGIDIRRIPAALIERVEVIQGVPSARYGDLTQGSILVSTRAGRVSPVIAARYDPRNREASLLGGWGVAGSQTLSATFDLADTRLRPGRGDDRVYRFASQIAHRAAPGATHDEVEAGAARLILDTRLDLFQLDEDSPEDPEVVPGRAFYNRDGGGRLSHRLRYRPSEPSRIDLTASLDWTRQRSMSQALQVAGVTPFTDRLEEGRATGRYLGGEYLSRIELRGEMTNFYLRAEGLRRVSALGAEHELRSGIEARREWNSGEGLVFDMAAPPSIGFDGIRGFDRPRPFDAIPALTSSALYLDDVIRATPFGDALLELQAGVRADLLHEGEHWLSGAADAVPQHRVSARFAPVPWLRFAAGHGRTAKLPTAGALHPAPQYFDLVNVNWFANDPAERLAVITTFIRDPSNPELGLSRGRKMEAGFEIAVGPESSLSFTAFDDRIDGGVGLRRRPDFLLRERYELSDSTQGTGRPPEIIEPPAGADTIPILLDVPDHTLDLTSRGFEVVARLPEIRPLRTRLEIHGASISTRLYNDAADFGFIFADFQRTPSQARSPFWEGITNTGRRDLVTYRLVHHQPALGLVVSGTLQHILREERQNLGGTDTLAFAGYVTREGELVRVPAEQRGLPEFADLRRPRAGAIVDRTEVPSDWLFNLQVSAMLPRDARLSFYAFNVFDRLGRFGDSQFLSRRYPSVRFGLELTVPLGGEAGR